MVSPGRTSPTEGTWRAQTEAGMSNPDRQMMSAAESRRMSEIDSVTQDGIHFFQLLGTQCPIRAGHIAGNLFQLGRAGDN